MKVSIIIVNYKVRDKLFACLDSIYKSKPKIEFEVIVVNNDEQETVKQDLLKTFPEVKYFKSSKNLGFGAGNNLGASHAKGEYLFFLNPDTIFLNNVIDGLYKLIKSDKKIGIVAPVLLDINKIEYSKQGTVGLTPFKALLHFSFLSRFFKNSHYFIEGWNNNGLREVNVCPGSALMVSRKVFEKTGGFDEKFFLYFEEFDFCRRVKELGFKIYIVSKFKVIHEWGISTKHLENRDQIFSKSRFYYFKKHYGNLQALFVEAFLRINKFTFSLFLILCLSLFLRIVNLSSSMVFIGDQGWFYLSARDLLLNGNIPLVGITSSHTWLHQGPLWTYLLAGVLRLSNFNPLSGAYLTAVLGSLTVLMVYLLGSKMFSKNTGIIAALLYATSPLIVYSDRMPYHTSPIPFFVLLFFFGLYKWLNGNAKYFPLILFTLALLYNFELATFLLFFPFALFFVYGFIKKKPWFKNIFIKRIIIYSLISVILPMLPIIIYDFSNGFKQTVIFLGWTIYKPFSFLISHSSGNLLTNLGDVASFLMVSMQKIVFQFNFTIALSIIGFSIVYLISKNLKSLKISSPHFILLFLLAFLSIGILVNQTPSDAYIPIIFTFVIFAVAVFFERLLNIKAISFALVIFIFLIVLINSYSIFLISRGDGFKTRTLIADEIILLAQDRSYNLIGSGPGSQFESFTANYEYLLWWKGHAPSHKTQKLKIVVSEEKNTIRVYKK